LYLDGFGFGRSIAAMNGGCWMFPSTAVPFIRVSGSAVSVAAMPPEAGKSLARSAGGDRVDNSASAQRKSWAGTVWRTTTTSTSKNSRPPDDDAA
jgi:hypothetical protein